MIPNLNFPRPPMNMHLLPPPPMPHVQIGNLTSRKSIGQSSLKSPDLCELNETIYVNNLNTRVKEPELRGFLAKIFGEYGKCEIIVMSSLRRRGQAWVIFETKESAAKAQSECHGQLAFGKPMRVSFSRNISDTTRARQDLPPRSKVSVRRALPSSSVDDRGKGGGKASGAESFFSTSNVVPRTAPRTYAPPNKLLLVENLTEAITPERLRSMFSAFPGFVEARVISSRGIAFVEFVDEYKSQDALTNLQNFEIEAGRCLQISNARC